MARIKGRKHKGAIREFVLMRAARQQYNVEIVIDLTTVATQMEKETLYSQLKEAGFNYSKQGWERLPHSLT